MNPILQTTATFQTKNDHFEKSKIKGPEDRSATGRLWIDKEVMVEML